MKLESRRAANEWQMNGCWGWWVLIGFLFAFLAGLVLVCVRLFLLTRGVRFLYDCHLICILCVQLALVFPSLFSCKHRWRFENFPIHLHCDRHSCWWIAFHKKFPSLLRTFDGLRCCWPGASTSVQGINWLRLAAANLHNAKLSGVHPGSAVWLGSGIGCLDVVNHRR